MGEAVDKVRKQEHKELMEQDQQCLKGTKYLWLYSQENMPKQRWQEFKTLKGMDLEVSRNGVRSPVDFYQRSTGDLSPL